MSRLMTLLFLSGLAVAQTTQPTPKPATPAAKPPAPAASPAQKPAAPAELPPTAPVITIDGVCNGKVPATPSPNCKTVVTRAQFEKLVDALDPKMPPPRRQQLAEVYARMLVLSDAADQRGVASSPGAEQVLHFTRMQTLTQLLLRDLQKQAAEVPPAETEAYYKAHINNYEQGTVQRIFIPKTPPGGEKPPDDKTLKAEADKIRAAAASGGDFEKLQKQAYDDLGIKTPPPPSNIGSERRGSLPPGQAKVFELQPGQVSDVIDEPGGFYIYKLDSKKQLTLPEVTPEINRTLESERMKDAVDKLTKNIKPVFNDQYFGGMAGGPPGGAPNHPAMPPRRAPGPAPAPPGAAPPAGKPPAQ